MSDPRNILQNKYAEQNRYQNFGDAITRIHVRGFRCHTNTIIDIESPVTAFCGLNGTGKSTLLQLLAVSYQSLDTSKQRSFYIRDFIVVGTLDPTPFHENATIEYRFWQENSSFKQLTLSRNSKAKRWRGYDRRLQSSVFFAGIGLYLPRIEKRDFIVRNANNLVIESSQNVAERVKTWTCKVLGKSYDSIHASNVTYSKRRGEIVIVERIGKKYSEAHMGYGEGRTQYLISALESLPDKSLVLIEEPETSLHQSAQYQLGKYFVDIAIKKGHQIFLTTHSEYLLDALHSKSRVYLHQTGDGIQPLRGLTSSQAKSLMTEGYHKSLCILVEDVCAEAILSEIIRRIDSQFLSSIGIYPRGDKDTIATAVRAFSDTGLNVAAVRDADMTPIPRENIYSLPGTEPPEKEIFKNQHVKDYISRIYQLNLDDFLISIDNRDHNSWFKLLAQKICQCDKALVRELAREYVKYLSEIEISTLVDQLKESASS